MSRAAIIGAGVIGGGWAARFLLNGWDVAVHDPSEAARERLGEVLDRARHALPMLYERALPPEGRLSFADSIAEAVTGADYIQESVPERLDLKHRVFAEIEAANADVPLGSSTSGFKPSDLGADLASAHRRFVAHPFNPVYLLPLVEVVGPSDVTKTAARILGGLGFHPLLVRGEIDAHIADRLLEAVWREALWLVSDDIGTTGEIDEAIRQGFGLRWAQMGLFETYRIAGGAGGMAHFVEQFGPALDWPWSRLTDVPEMTPELAAKIGAQSDDQSGHLSIADLEALRDRNLVAILRALKREGSGAGRTIAAHEATLPDTPSDARPIVTVRRVIPSDWTDYNGHMNESRYGQIWSDAADALLAMAGAGPETVDTGFSYFTAETKTNFRDETLAGEPVRCETEVTLADGKKLRLLHRMKRDADGAELATCDQFLLHVSLETRRSCPPDDAILTRLRELAGT